MPRLVLAGFALLLLTLPALAQGRRPALVEPWTACRTAIQAAERDGRIPEHLLAAIGLVESGRRDPAGGSLSPWPWTINAEGQGFFYASKAEAIAAVRKLQERGVRSIDVGCMQVNLMHHPDAFASLDQAFEPPTNAVFAARFLNQLHAQTGDWPKAAALYHSATPDLAAVYQRRVLAAWPEERRNRATSLTAQLATAWAATLGDGAPSNRVAVILPNSRSDGIRVIPLTR